MVCVILQTIALPTELPRRDLHFTGDSVAESNGGARHGVANHVRSSAMVSARQARRRQDHCACCRYQTIETIALLTPLSRPVCMPAASDLTAPNHGAVKLLRFVRALAQRRRDEARSLTPHGCAVRGGDEFRTGAISEPGRRSSVGHGDPSPAEGLRQARTIGTRPLSKSPATARTPRVARLCLRPLRRRNQSGCRRTDRFRPKATRPAMAALEVRDSRTPDTRSVVVTSSPHHGLRNDPRVSKDVTLAALYRMRTARSP